MRERERKTDINFFFFFFQINIQNIKPHSTHKHTKPTYNEQGYVSFTTINVTYGRMFNVVWFM